VEFPFRLHSESQLTLRLGRPILAL
jgi:hypothetical protein